jgi:hypothetical protein
MNEHVTETPNYKLISHSSHRLLHGLKGKNEELAAPGQQDASAVCFISFVIM